MTEEVERKIEKLERELAELKRQAKQAKPPVQPPPLSYQEYEDSVMRDLRERGYGGGHVW